MIKVNLDEVNIIGESTTLFSETVRVIDEIYNKLNKQEAKIYLKLLENIVEQKRMVLKNEKI